MLSYPSATAKKAVILTLSLFLSLSGLDAAFGADWELDFPISERTARILEERFPSIDSRESLSRLLKTLGRMETIRRLEVIPKDGGLLIKGVPARRIREIKFDLTTRLFLNRLESLVVNYVGQVDSQEVRNSLTSEIHQFLVRQGFPNVELNLAKYIDDDDGKVVLTFKVVEGYPCLVDQVELGFSLPRGYEKPIEEGDICDIDSLTDDLRDLEEELRDEGYSSAKFEEPEIQRHPETNSATFVLKGKVGPLIKYVVEEEGRSYGLTDLFSDDDWADIDPNMIGPEAMVSQLQRQYQNLGYADAQVSQPKLTKRGDRERIYTYEVKPGVLYELTDVRFEGATRFSDDELLGYMNLRGFWQTAPALNLDEVRNGIEAIKAAYNQEGYWDAVVRDPRITKNQESATAQMIILINEGRRRVLQNITISGNQFLADDEIRDMFPTETGSSLDRNDLVELETAVKSRYIESGYLYVEPKITIDENQIGSDEYTSVKLAIKEGVRVRVGEIFVSGLIQTKEKVVLRELRFEAGDWYDPEDVESSRRALIRLGLFRSVQIVPADPLAMEKQPPYLDLVIRVRETSPGNVSFGPGWSLFRGLRYTGEGSYNNILGVGRQVFVRGRVSEEANQSAIAGPRTLLGRSLSVGYLEPYIFEQPINMQASASHRAQADTIWSLTIGWEIALVHRLRHLIEGSQVSVFYGQKIHENTATEEQIAADEATPQIRIGEVGIRYRQDERDDISWPTDGFILNVETSWARFPFGSEVRYFYWHIDNSYYFGLFEDWVIAIGSSLSMFQDIERTSADKKNSLPRSERLQLSGSNYVVRGFRERDLGPYHRDVEDADVKDAAGGTHRALFRLELRHQVWKDTAGITAFIDAGNTFYRPNELGVFQKGNRYISDNVYYRFEELFTNPEFIWKKNYVSHGLALNYLTPIGSFNFAYGWPWKRCGGVEKQCDVARGNRSDVWLQSGQFHINVGATF